MTREQESPRWKLVWFAERERHEVLVRDARTGAKAYIRLRDMGLKACLVSRRKAYWPPDDDDLSLLSKGMLWCPYCRAWRWFKPTKTVWPYNGIGRWICHFCQVSEADFYVRQMNGIWDRPIHGRRKKRRRKR